MPSVATPSKAGIVEDQTGERHIPASVRPDGSKRKEIKIRPGYKPPEDVEVYKNRIAEGFRNRGSGGVPGAEGLKDDEPGPSTTANKNAKRREARKKAKAAEDSVGASSAANGEVATSDAPKEEPEKELVDLEVEREKKARNLKKKLKQAKELKEKKEGGAALLPEQFAKVIKINELIRELDALGFDSEGEPKATDKVTA
jgi:partner of Y14 and mago